MNKMQKLAFEIGRQIELEKLAKKDNRPEAGFWAKEDAVRRAMSVPDKKGGLKSHPDFSSTDRAIKILGSTVAGGALGVGASTLARKLISRKAGIRIDSNDAKFLDLLGGATVGSIGMLHSKDKADKEFLAKRGIKARYLHFPFPSIELSNEAKKKYLHKDYKGGGYSPKK